MARPPLEPHLRRLLTDEKTEIMSLFQVNKNESGPFFCSMSAPVETISDLLAHGNCYAYAEGPTPEDAVHTARQKLWNGL
jgi:hypothetical protein